MKQNFWKRYTGDKAFYRMVLMIVVPIIIQNGITNFVSLLDNIMVGQVGTEQMSGVAIVNQFMTVFNICIFGGVSSAGIFTAQYYGQGSQEGVRNTFRFKFIICLLMTVFAIVLFLTAGEELIMLYLHEGAQTGDIARTLEYGKEYLAVIIFGIAPYAVSQTYASTLRETGETVLPMKAGIIAVLVNLLGNFLLIFGNFGFPALGAVGAALATDIARVVECVILMCWTYSHRQEHPFIEGAFRSLRIPKELTVNIIRKGIPIMLNEIAWSTGQAFLMQCYSVRGLSVVAGLNISSTVSNLFNVVFLSIGGAIAIIVGQLLGAGKMEEARDTDRKLLFFTVSTCLVCGSLLALISPFFPLIYNTSGEVQSLATGFILIAAGCMPLYAFMHGCYFTLRSGGKTWITVLFDSVYVWAVDIPLAFVLANFTGLPIVVVYLSCQLIETLKCILGYILVKKGIWLQNIVAA
ncbi:MATE efflux family protein [Eubacterium sp. 14-2]|uniref:MATE family efflux transporter n=1 Tax=Eubacterium sp. 14-2 TaxID=1235790 RepID=UPI0003404D94|nr:MATE family efflux transporter [Eubacterium sp. 14-2]EOT27230.1 MATE efflux family protein [Eubacterium sp. 14-2]